MKRMALLGLAVVLATSARAISFDSFGPKGEGGAKNGQVFQLGSGGTVYELDAFLSLAGQDLNGAQTGTAAMLSSQELPPGLTYSFSAALSNSSDAVLTYLFVNQTNQTFTNLLFNVLLDAEIDQEVNTFFNEYGRVIGALGIGPGDPEPDMWQIDEPGFENGTLFNNLFFGTLNNSNSLPQSAVNDVAFGLGFTLGDLAPGQTAAISVMISDASHYLGTFALQQLDQDPNSTGIITLSAIVSTLTGTIFRDQNTNDVFEPGEGLVGVRMLLQSDGQTVAQTLTDVNGNYSFNNPTAGEYIVQVDTATLPAGLTNSLDPDGMLDGFTTTSLAPGQLRILNWGYRASAGVQELADVTALASLKFTWRLKPSTGSLIGTLTITNLPSSVAALGSPFRVGFPTSTNFWYAHPEGTLDNELPYVDLTSGVTAQTGDALSPGESAVVDGIEIFSRNRSAPPTSLFRLWATQQP